MLTFDAPTHTYRFAGAVVPSVTQVLACASRFEFVTAEQLEAARDRGTYTHSLCEFDDLGQLDEDEERDGEHWPRLLAWRKFCRDFGANWAGIEERFYSRSNRLAGTLDRRGKLELFDRGLDLWLIDVKTGETLDKLWGLQLAAYKQLVTEFDMNYALARRASVRLLADGTYRFDEFKGRDDWEIFRAMLTLTHWSQS